MCFCDACFCDRIPTEVRMPAQPPNLHKNPIAGTLARRPSQIAQCVLTIVVALATVLIKFVSKETDGPKKALLFVAQFQR